MEEITAESEWSADFLHGCIMLQGNVFLIVIQKLIIIEHL